MKPHCCSHDEFDLFLPHFCLLNIIWVFMIDVVFMCRFLLEIFVLFLHDTFCLSASFWFCLISLVCYASLILFCISQFWFSRQISCHIFASILVCNESFPFVMIHVVILSHFHLWCLIFIFLMNVLFCALGSNVSS